MNNPRYDLLAEAQDAGEIIDAEQILQRAYETDVRPLLEQVRLEMGPLAGLSQERLLRED